MRIADATAASVDLLRFSVAMGQAIVVAFELNMDEESFLAEAKRSFGECRELVEASAKEMLVEARKRFEEATKPYEKIVVETDGRPMPTAAIAEPIEEQEAAGIEEE